VSIEAIHLISLAGHLGNPYIGVYCVASNEHAFVPRDIENSLFETIEESLEVKALKFSVSSATIIGSLTAMNSNGVVLSNYASDDEIDLIPKGLEVAKMQENFNAAGNNILVTDKAALVNPGVLGDTLRTLSDVFGVEVARGTIAGVATVGSVALATGKGIICHPRATEDNIAHLKDLFKVPVTLATLNYGTPWLGACAIANDKGAVVGEKSTPIEIGKLEDGLHLY
jgi:translation initiation factor 6